MHKPTSAVCIHATTHPHTHIIYLRTHLAELGGVLGAQGQDDEGEVLVLRALLPQLLK